MGIQPKEQMKGPKSTFAVPPVDSLNKKCGLAKIIDLAIASLLLRYSSRFFREFQDTKRSLDVTIIARKAEVESAIAKRNSITW
ncbi:hypothetical protein C5167_008790 [Papaver somniferum]|uniref:Uncharacterized protein n=1 Tax=Papaver somniferum TaxID=3469 RepID=A0A4Y7JWZ7_PAPSO|nr:hypothetical protein C5167_008790 [Papaver somniferum]